MVINLCNLKHNTWRLTSSVWGLVKIPPLDRSQSVFNFVPQDSHSQASSTTPALSHNMSNVDFFGHSNSLGAVLLQCSVSLSTHRQTESNVFFFFRFFVFVCLCLAPVASLSAQRLNLSFSQCISFPQGR